MTNPVILLGHGVRSAGVDPAPLLELGIPVLTSWPAKDLVDNSHPAYFGSPGIYGQRIANWVLHHADTVYAVGNRLSIWNVGYEGIRPDQRLVMVDCDEEEIAKVPHSLRYAGDITHFVACAHQYLQRSGYYDRCVEQRDRFPPFVESDTHADVDGYINSYRFTSELSLWLNPDQVIVADMGTPVICAHQVLKLKPPQRLLTSGGLGEMGCGLPYAIGASFARDKGEVLCLEADGSMMLNLQELQTIAHHSLPVKIIVYRNDSYLMIRHTQKVLGMPETAVAPESDVSFPDYRKLAQTFGIRAVDVRTWHDFYAAMPAFFATEAPALVQYWMHPRQPLVPKLNPIRGADGAIRSPRFCDMSPLLEGI